MSISHDYFSKDSRWKDRARRTLWVVYLTLLTMLIELGVGYWSGSMALVADGWHMASHVAALFISYLAYYLASHPRVNRQLNFGGGKLIPLGGYTSAIFLLIVAMGVAMESSRHLLHPAVIQYREALAVAVLGLMVNLISAWILHEKGHHHHHHHHHDKNHDHPHHHHHHHMDLNLKGAYLHVVADALTSVAAIFALTGAWLWNLNWLDSLVGLLGAMLILRWSLGLLKESSWELLDGRSRHHEEDEIRKRLECEHVKVIDLHIWTIAPQVHACELVVESDHRHGLNHFRKILQDEFQLEHVIVEERVKSESSGKQGC